MKAKLIITLSGFERAETNGLKYQRHYFIELEKSFKIPLVPFIGLQLRFDPISTGHKNPLFRPEIEPIIFDACFDVYALDYDTLKKQFDLQAGQSCGNLPNLISSITQLENGYGFLDYRTHLASYRVSA